MYFDKQANLRHRHFFLYAKLGDSLFRAYQNEFLRTVEVDKSILDLGTKSLQAKHLRYLRFGDTASFTFTDLHPEDDSIIKVDFRKRLPFPDNSYDAVLAMNILEHLEKPESLLCEIERVLKPGGKFVGVVPFMFPYHADPGDYGRYTHEGMAASLRAAGLREAIVVKLGVGSRTVASAITTGFYKLWPLRWASWVLAYFFDNLRRSFGPLHLRKKTENFYLGTGFTATKSPERSSKRYSQEVGR